MSMIVECYTCQVKLRLPANGKGRCPRCKEVIQAPEQASATTPTEQDDAIPEISAEHEVESAPSAIAPFPVAPTSANPPRLPPPLPGPRRRRRDSVPDIDIAHPLPPPSRVLPVTLLTIAFLVSLISVVGSFIYLVQTAKDHRPNAPPPIFGPRR